MKICVFELEDISAKIVENFEKIISSYMQILLSVRFFISVVIEASG